MKNFFNSKTISIGLTILFLLLQVLATRPGTAGPYCFPALTETGTEGHPMYEVTGYGFPLSAAGFVTNTCAGPHTTEFEWFGMGLALNGFILLGLSFPLWGVNLKRFYR
ncbi:MAG: hypothetical protein IH589_12105 [Anaerolineales bacterium]|nr:hypothetical protein [Anaerolineales bacterium]